MSGVSLETARMLHQKGWLRDRISGYFKKGDRPVWRLAYLSQMKKWHVSCSYLVPVIFKPQCYSSWFDTADEALEWVEMIDRTLPSDPEVDDADV